MVGNVITADKSALPDISRLNTSIARVDIER
jgi:hypothetical protein